MAAARLTVSLGVLAWCLSEVPLSDLVPMLDQARVLVLAMLVPLVLFEAYAGAMRFKLILDTVHVLPIRTHVAQYFVVGYFNIALPSSMGGDAVRVLMLTRTGAGVTDATLAVLVDRILGVYSLVFIALLAVIVVEVPGPLMQLIYGISLAMTLAGAVALVGYRRAHAYAGRWRWLDRALETLRRMRGNPLAILRSAAMSLLFQFLTISFTWLVAAGFGVSVEPAQIFALVPLTWLATMVPVSVGGLGVREVSFTYLFGMVGVPAAEALLLSLGTYAVFVAIALTGAAVMAFARGKRQDRC